VTAGVWVIGGSPHAAPGRPAVAAPAAPAIALAFHPGLTRSFHLTMAMHGSIHAAQGRAPFDMQLSADMAWRITRVSATGTATVVVSMTDVSLDVDGEQMPTHVPPKTTWRITKDGRVLAWDGSTLFSGDLRGPAELDAQNVSAILPRDGAGLHPGDRWSRTTNAILLGQPLGFMAHSTFVGRTGGGSVAIVRTRAAVPVDLTLRLAAIAHALRLPARRIPADAAITYAGRERVTTTSWIDTAARQLARTRATAAFDLTLRVRHLPATGIAAGGVRLQGSATMTLDAL
jgi:hypothetical protein